MKDYDAIVIGAGLGGLSCGALLAKQGRKVIVLEQSDMIGGCCSTYIKEGFGFDVGASLVEILHPIELAFKRLGTTLKEEVDLIPCDPIVTCVLRDGSKITYPSSMKGTEEALAKFSAKDEKNWKKYAAFFYELTDVLYNTLFSGPADSLGDMMRMVRKEPRILKFLPTYLSSYQSLMKKYFSTRIQDSFAFQAFYFGLPPELLPGVFALVPCTEHRGLFYPKGGMIQIPKAFERCGKRFGMELKLKSRVDKILVRNNRAVGVRLTDGTEITSNVVVSNINAKTLYQQLIGEDKLPWLARMGVKSYECSLALPMIYLGIDYEPPLVGHHTLIAPTVGEINEYWKNRLDTPIPDKQFGLIGWSTFTDPSMASEGLHVLNLTMTGAYRLKGTTWDTQKKPFIENVIKWLSKEIVPGLEQHVKIAEATTPLDFERRIGLAEGAIYGLAQDLPSGTVFRPANKSKSIDGLYLAGCSTNPGGGVPTVIASGTITARLIEKYEQ
jgi:phytoene desaturase